jgi:hypothetical protein
MRRSTPVAATPALALLALLSCDHSPTAPRLDQLTLDVVSGDGQTAVVGHELAPLVVKVTSGGNPVAQQVLNFRVVSGGGSVYGGTELTDPDGIAQEIWTLGTKASDVQKVEVRAVESSTGAEKVFATFMGTALADKAAKLTAAAGDNQAALAGSTVLVAPAALVTDQYGNPIAGVSVTFAVATGGGSATGLSQTTNATGVATVGTWTLGTAAGTNTLTAATPGLALAGSPVTFMAVGTTGTAAQLVLVSGNDQSASPGSTLPNKPTVRVIDGNGNGVPNVAVTFTVTSGGGSIDGVGSVTTLTSAGTTSMPAGSAAVSWTLGPAAGPNTLQATAVGLSGSPLVFGASATQPTWIAVSPSGVAPPNRWDFGNVYDPSTNAMIIFGGMGGISNGRPLLNDVWLLSGANGSAGAGWTQLNPGGTAPSPRGERRTAYDPGTNRMILFGGNPNVGNCFGITNDLWVLTNANGQGGTPSWIQLAPSTAGPIRQYPSQVYDPTSNTLIVFGGLTNACQLPYTNDVWLLSGANGAGATPSWSQAVTAGSPPPARTGHSAVYDPTTNSMIVFAGAGPGGDASGLFNDVWILAHATGVSGTPTWTQLTPAGTAPPGRSGHTSVYDVNANTMTVFGGAEAGRNGNDVWVLTHANGMGGMPTWSQLVPSGGSAPGRAYHAALYDPLTSRMTVYAGIDACNCTLLGDVWVLTDANGK